jgi:hypothetical protein
MRTSIKIAREIDKRCFRINEVIDGKGYLVVFDRKLCAEILEENFTSYNKASAPCRHRWQWFNVSKVGICSKCGARSE